ncbi:MAG: DUF4097 family beta strand repeat protein [Gemmatimonadaceae bacterium]|nr:DUF4097 family beta strand repeat protein [Gemmatimonadaceae bacterium]
MTRRLALAVLVASTTLTACDEGNSGPRQTRKDAFEWSGAVAAGKTLSVRSLRGDITVEPSSDSMVHVSADYAWRRGDPDKDLTISGTTTADGALICAMIGDNTCTEKEFEANIKLGNDSPDIRVTMRIRVPHDVKVNVAGADGDVTISASAPVRAFTMNGDVTVATAVGPVKGESLNGDIDLRMTTVTGTDSIIGKTLNGDVFVYMTELSDASVEMEVVMGKVQSEFPLTIQGEQSDKKLRSTVGTGARAVHLKSITGDVALRKLDASGRAP